MVDKNGGRRDKGGERKKEREEINSKKGLRSEYREVNTDLRRDLENRILDRNSRYYYLISSLLSSFSYFLSTLFFLYYYS